ncbi:MAG: NAD+ synthase [Bacteroidetes bacterium GWE2_29_8]|nr:MAG: NAD+ synthase [Bacteroidetes bacterium GWE2_29_8]OFY14443.1 MAG: NAD+ synthase [Bacteroidetes bacterium GWF2_29_10]
MKIALAQQNFHVGNIEFNKQKIIQSIIKAQNAEVDLIVFSELAICGYPPKDLLLHDSFITKCLLAVEDLKEYSKNIGIIIGAPSVNKTGKGKKLYNSAYYIYENKIQKIINKSLLPTYDVFDEYRYFEPAKETDIIVHKNTNIALTICEDIWNVDKNLIYQYNPLDDLSLKQPLFVINIAASPFSYNQRDERENIIRTNCEKYNTPLFYVNQIGANTELIFDGESIVANKEGKIVCKLNSFEEDFRTFIIDNNATINIEKEDKGEQFNNKISLITEALVLGIKDYFGKSHLKRAILGLSGGIDSAVTLVLAVKALGNENVKAILLPSAFSSDHSVNDAVALCETMKVDYETINIEQPFQSFMNILDPYFANKPFDITEENMQARVRALILMSFSNKFGYILLNTSNKSEVAVGYGTLYGDMCGGLSVIGDVYKQDVCKMAEYINKDKEIIPINTIIKPPSAELRPDQKDSDSLPEYDILDKILFKYIEENKNIKQITDEGFDENIVKKVIRLVNINEHKRHQAAPILRVSHKAFGSGRCMPIVADYNFFY